MGAGGKSNHGSYTYDWLGEDRLASWLSGEDVVEAVLGDPDPSSNNGSAAVADGDGGGSAEADRADDQVRKTEWRCRCDRSGWYLTRYYGMG